ncbi:hypothetical protein [Dactylosporangium sp. CS-033363]|uniref:hypothetical protein n=1 Tax=Dactylosporangium sp. CS-033363 TaxID=3239935 RepID=UPI003D8F8FB3
MLGTSNVCSLFDAGLLDAAVPDGSISVSELTTSDDAGSGGVCEVSNVSRGDWSVLRLNINKEYTGSPAQRREDSAVGLRWACDKSVTQAPVTNGESPAEESCANLVTDADQAVPMRLCQYAARRADTLVWGYYQFLPSLTPAQADHNCQVTRDVANSALSRVA